MRAVMARSLTLYLDRHCGQPPRRVVVHKTTPFRDAETDGCFDALSSAGELELIQVIDDTPWRGVQLGPPKGGARAGRAVPANYPCKRGTLVHLGSYETLLWTQGDAPDVAYAGSFFKEGVGIPRPAAAAPLGRPRPRRPDGRRSPRADEDELEQRRALRHPPDHPAVRPDPRAGHQDDAQPAAQALFLPAVHLTTAGLPPGQVSVSRGSRVRRAVLAGLIGDGGIVPLEYSIERLTCAVASRLDAVMVG